MTVPLLIFATVTLGVFAGSQLLSGLLGPGASKVRRRLAEEFRKGQAGGPPAQLFKKLDQLSIDLSSGGKGVPRAARRSMQLGRMPVVWK